MAKTNKYTSINFNQIYEKTLPSNSNPNSKPIKKPSSSSSSSSPSYSAISSPKTHGRMLVLTRPTPTSKPKPITTPSPPPPPPPQPLSPQPQQSQLIPERTRSDPGSDQISLRPLGSTGSGSPALSPVPSFERDKEVVGVVTSPKPDKFVPPHLRPGFSGREERIGPDVVRVRESGRNNFGSPGRYGEDGRPKSGGGYERMMRGDESELGMANRPRSSGSRPGSSGWYGSLLIFVDVYSIFVFLLL